MLVVFMLTIVDLNVIMLRYAEYDIQHNGECRGTAPLSYDLVICVNIRLA